MAVPPETSSMSLHCARTYDHLAPSRLGIGCGRAGTALVLQNWLTVSVTNQPLLRGHIQWRETRAKLGSTSRSVTG